MKVLGPVGILAARMKTGRSGKAMIWYLKPLIIFLFLGCSPSKEGGAPVTGKPLLPEGVDIDLFKVSEAVWARESKYGFGELSEPERTFLCVWNLEAEVNNGGFDQFFVNSAGDYARETPGALRVVGATEMASIVERAMTPFGEGGPPRDRDKRLKAMESISKKAEKAWGKLDEAFSELASPEDGLRAFVESHRREFYAP
jgi:uncharacterized protein DUF4375